MAASSPAPAKTAAVSRPTIPSPAGQITGTPIHSAGAGGRPAVRDWVECCIHASVEAEMVFSPITALQKFQASF